MAAIDTLNAFCEHGFFEREGEGDRAGALSGLRFALKDAFDVADVPTGAGSPEWLETHPIPTRSAPIVETLLGAGARLVGKTKMDELAWSLIGENAHYGTPINVNAPGRVPGGSSSGSAAVVAAKVVDFSIGSDTGGSVRLPASFCGIYGIRPTHNRVPISGGVPLAPSYDTVGWFARDPQILFDVGKVLLPGFQPPRPPKHVVVARDLVAAAGEQAAEALRSQIDKLAERVGSVRQVDVAGDDLGQWVEAFRLIQSHEVWTVHGDWIASANPRLGPGVRERFTAAAALDPEQVKAARALRVRIRNRMYALVADGGILVFPTAPGVAPLRNLPDEELQSFRVRALGLLCPAGHSGLPHISMPLGAIDGLPVGLSVVADQYRDEDLLRLATEVA
ncbi:amidase [Bradyrhizobium cenepequi]